jgi:hypothetical protein
MKSLWTAIALVVAVAASGCTHAMIQPMPELKGQLGLRISEDKASGWTDMPIGVHRIPETSVYVSGHQGAAGVGVLFGPIGLAAAHAAAQSTGEKKTGDSTALRIDIAAEADRVLKEELERRRDVVRFAPPGSRAEATLEVVPFIVLTFIGEDRVRPWVVLKTALKNATGDEKWKTRYMTSLGDPRPLAGDNGWTIDGGEPLRKAIDRSLRVGVDVMLRDAAGTLPRGKGRVVKLRGNWVWVKQSMEVTGEILEETPDLLVVKPEVADAIVFAGISIVDPRTLTVTSPEKDK